jgi:hypothetical protein
MQSGTIGTLIISLGTAYFLVVTINSLFVIPLGEKKSYPQRPLKRRLAGPQTRSAYFGEPATTFSTPANRNLVHQPMTISLKGTIILQYFYSNSTGYRLIYNIRVLVVELQKLTIMYVRTCVCMYVCTYYVHLYVFIYVCMYL